MQVQLILKNLELVVKRALVEPVECRGAEHLIAGLGLISPKGIIKHLWRSTLNSTLIYGFFFFCFFFLLATSKNALQVVQKHLQAPCGICLFVFLNKFFQLQLQQTSDKTLNNSSKENKTRDSS